MPAPGFTLREIPRLNQMIYRKHHRRPLQGVLDDYHSYHERVVNLIKTLSDADLVTLGRFSWTGSSWTLSDYLPGEYSSTLSVGPNSHSSVVEQTSDEQYVKLRWSEGIDLDERPAALSGVGGILRCTESPDVHCGEKRHLNAT